MQNLIERMTQILDYNISKVLELQIAEESSINFGRIMNLDKGFAEPNDASLYALMSVCAYYNKYSQHYKSEALLKFGINAIRGLLAAMNDDNTINLMETNFHDCTMNGFAIHNIGIAYHFIKSEIGQEKGENEFINLLYEFIERSGEAMYTGGFHTPNHRWVVSSSLSYCYNITGDERFKEHLQKYLNEGIDCDEEGEFTERSAGVYNIICNKSLDILADELGMPELYSHITRNLNMVMKYMEPDDTLCTINSTRQDFGKAVSFDVYHECYLSCAAKTGNPEFKWIADHAFDTIWTRFCINPDSATISYGLLVKLLMNNDLFKKLTAITPIKPDNNFEKHYVKSGIVRMRQGDVTLSLVKDRAVFLKLQYGMHTIYVRFAGSYFGPKGQFLADSIEKTKEGYRLTYTKACGYKRPFDKAPDTSDWSLMEHDKRDNVNIQTWTVNIDAALKNGKLTLAVESLGVTSLPVKLELINEACAIYQTEDTLIKTHPGNYIFLKKGSAEYIFPDHYCFEVNGGFFEHWYGETMRGSLPPDKNAATICFTGISPMKHEISIECKKYTGE